MNEQMIRLDDNDLATRRFAVPEALARADEQRARPATPPIGGWRTALKVRGQAGLNEATAS